MGCKCRNQPVNVPANIEWGPVFWTLLHGLAEKAGTAPLPGLQGDEVRAWKIILTTLPKALACEECRNHLNSHITNNPINIPDKYSDLRPYIRVYLHNLHESVNKRLKKDPFPLVDLPLLYRGIDLKKSFEIVNTVVKRSILATAVPILSWNNWASQVRTLIGMYN
jgi:hypothetical protein